jgi:hypothetical protein
MPAPPNFFLKISTNYFKVKQVDILFSGRVFYADSEYMLDVKTDLLLLKKLKTPVLAKFPKRA